MEARRDVSESVSDAPVLYAVDDGVATVTLHRPDRMNAWTYEIEVAYFDLVDALDDDPGGPCGRPHRGGPGLLPGARCR